MTKVTYKQRRKISFTNYCAETEQYFPRRDQRNRKWL